MRSRCSQFRNCSGTLLLLCTRTPILRILTSVCSPMPFTGHPCSQSPALGRSIAENHTYVYRDHALLPYLSVEYMQSSWEIKAKLREYNQMTIRSSCEPVQPLQVTSATTSPTNYFLLPHPTPFPAPSSSRNFSHTLSPHSPPPSPPRPCYPSLFLPSSTPPCTPGRAGAASAAMKRGNVGARGVRGPGYEDGGDEEDGGIAGR